MKSIQKIFQSRLVAFFAIVCFIVIADQITKALVHSNFFLGESLPLVPGFFSLTYIRNTGAAFGFLAGASEWVRNVMFLWLSLGVSIWLILLIWQSRERTLLEGLAYTLIFGGAAGNLIDRFRLGYVVDFLDFYFRTSHYPAFNVADSCITVGAILIVAHHLLFEGRSRKMKIKRKT
jgi:signal peptidase II